ncbi:polar amino acid transport system substrate-binding protein [Duganella sp. CF458]|uniref:substrate-binding periplasmic protein n=1 Tax=Duganella sp. CF458 TaxID=1884368 RepID=UPI0008DFDDF1|nr:transporter substrate-binding domain-containing protein [Duganella sp. CF458]SFF63233.1 polar amino acid transport system substrate-binding protein [Duganella sp. CF458]
MRLLPLLFALAAAPAIGGPICPAPLHAGASDLGLASFRENDKVRGAAIDVLRELARRTNCSLNISWYPRARLWAEYANGRINLTASSARSAERDRLGQFVPFVTTRFDLVLSRRVPGSFTSLAQFVDQGSARLNLVRGILYPPEVLAQVERLRQQGRVEMVNDFDIAFRKMASQRAEATLAPMTIYSRYLQSSGLQGFVAVMPVTESAPVLAGAYLSRDGLAPAVRKVFADALLGMVADGSVARIYGKYVGGAHARALVPAPRRAIISAYQPLP